MRALEEARDLLLDRNVLELRPLAHLAREALGSEKAALAAVESALLDGWARHHHLPLWSFFGGATTRLRTDITLVTGGLEETATAARRALDEGFTELKMKVGGGDVDHDARRIREVARLAPNVALFLDGNEAFTAQSALELLSALGEARSRIRLFEQPTPADDRDALAQVGRDGNVAVFADESARSVDAVVELARCGGVDGVNVKITKTGVFEAYDMLVTAKRLGLSLMLGGMVETELCMTVSACLGGGLGTVDHYDLDTPLFLGPRPLGGGFAQSGPDLDLSGISEGHGVFLTTP